MIPQPILAPPSFHPTKTTHQPTNQLHTATTTTKTTTTTALVLRTGFVGGPDRVGGALLEGRVAEAAADVGEAGEVVDDQLVVELGRVGPLVVDDVLQVRRRQRVADPLQVSQDAVLVAVVVAVAMMLMLLLLLLFRVGVWVCDLVWFRVCVLVSGMGLCFVFGIGINIGNRLLWVVGCGDELGRHGRSPYRNKRNTKATSKRRRGSRHQPHLPVAICYHHTTTPPHTGRGKAGKADLRQRVDLRGLGGEDLEAALRVRLQNPSRELEVQLDVLRPKMLQVLDGVVHPRLRACVRLG